MKDARMGLPPAMLAFMNGIEPTPSKRSLERVVVSEEERKARLAMDVPPTRDRPTDEPGGMECEECGCIFIGAEHHRTCAVCFKASLAGANGAALIGFKREPAADAEGWIQCSDDMPDIPAGEFEMLRINGMPWVSSLSSSRRLFEGMEKEYANYKYRLTTKEQS